MRLLRLFVDRLSRGVEACLVMQDTLAVPSDLEARTERDERIVCRRVVALRVGIRGDWRPAIVPSRFGDTT